MVSQARPIALSSRGPTSTFRLDGSSPIGAPGKYRRIWQGRSCQLAQFGQLSGIPYLKAVSPHSAQFSPSLISSKYAYCTQRQAIHDRPYALGHVQDKCR